VISSGDFWVVIFHHLLSPTCIELMPDYMNWAKELDGLAKWGKVDQDEDKLWKWLGAKD